MRVLLVHCSYRVRGGEDEAVHSLASALVGSGHSVETLYYRNHSNAVVDSIDFLRSAGNRESVRALTATWERFHPDVIHVHNTWFRASPSVIIAASKLAPTIVSLHNYRAHCISGDLTRDASRCEACLGGRIAVRGAAHGCFRSNRTQSLVACASSARLRDVLRRYSLRPGMWLTAPTAFARALHVKGGIPANRLRVVGNVIGQPSPAGRTVEVGKRADYVYVGRLSPEKGIRELLRCWSGFDSKGERLVLIGEASPGTLDGAILPPLVEVTGRLPRTEAIARVASARALVFPSICFENQPLSVLEALGVGTPVLFNRGGAAEEIVANDALGFEAGRPTSFHNVAALVQDVDFLQASSARALLHYTTQYDATKTVASVLSLYRVAQDEFTRFGTRLSIGS